MWLLLFITRLFLYAEKKRTLKFTPIFICREKKTLKITEDFSYLYNEMLMEDLVEVPSNFDHVFSPLDNIDEGIR